MINISDNSKMKLRSDYCPKHFVITIGNRYMFDENDIYQDSMSLTESIMADTVEYLGCISSKFEIKITNDNWESVDCKGEWITARAYIGPDVTSEDIPLFHGYIDSMEYDHAENTTKLVCYDALYYVLNSTAMPDGTLVYLWYKGLFSGADKVAVKGWASLKDIRNALMQKLGLQQAYNGFDGFLPNDGIKVKKRFSTKDLTVLELVQGLCQINGCFGIINREGKFEWRYISDDKLKRAKQAYPGCFYPGTLYPSDNYTQELDVGAEEEITVVESIESSKYTLNPIANRISVRNNADDSGQYVTSLGGDSAHYYKNYVTIGDDETDRDQDDPRSSDDDSEMVTGAYVLDGNMFAYKLKAKNKRIAAANIMEILGGGATFRNFTLRTYGLPYIEVGDRIKYEGSIFTITNRILTGDQVMFDEFSCEVDYEQGEYSTTPQECVAQLLEGLTEDDVRYISTGIAETTATDTVNGALSDPATQQPYDVLVVEKFEDGVLYTKSVQMKAQEKTDAQS